MIKRNRCRPSASLEARLLRFAEEARAAANFIAPGPEQDQLLRKAVKAETLASAAKATAPRDGLVFDNANAV